jgi:hypothetical protein
MNVMLYVAAIMAFAPALVLMFLVLRKYTYPAVEQPFFSDPSFFTLFTVGLVGGVILLYVYTYIWTVMVYVLMFAVIEALVLVVMLNLKRYHGKSDTVFYGYGLGLGFGCSMAFGLIYFLGETTIKSGDMSISPSGYVELFVIALGYLLMFAAIGTTVGEGIARLRPMEFALQAMFMNLVFYAVIFASFMNSGNVLYYVFMIAALTIAAVAFYVTMYVRLSGVVRDVLKMEGKKRDDVPR